MAFKKKTWIDRMVEFAGRRKITNVSTSAAQIIDVERAEGAVSQEGDAFSAENMNDLEKRISDAFADVPSGYKIADNDTTNNSEFLATARVAYEHGLEIDALSRDLSAVPEFVIDKSTGKITGYKTKAGADTVFPFSAPLLNMKFSQMPKVNYYTSTNLVFENPGYNRLKVTDCNANYWWVYNSPNFDVNNWGNELDTKYQIGNRNDTVFDITNVKYVLIHTKQSENNNSGFGGCKFNLCNE